MAIFVNILILAGIKLYLQAILNAVLFVLNTANDVAFNVVLK
jgi:hypothetical protein